MPLAAVPNYLGRDYSTAAPGHRFYLYFEAWEKSRMGQLEKVRDKTAAVKQCLTLNPNHKNTITALARRQHMLAGERVWQLPAQTVAPLTTGLGMEHPLENGFAFLNPYGLPYLPGSGIKGVLRQAARELRDDDSETGWDDPAIGALFGPATQDEARRGALIFWDVFPVLKTDSLAMEIMTPHQSHYYQEGKPPHDSGQPNPILFLAIPPGTPLTFYVDCDRRLLPEALRDDAAWQALLHTAFEHACGWLGFGAKTAVGYGHVEIDTRELERQEEQQRERQAEEDKKKQIDKATEELPEDAAWLEEKIQLGAWPDNSAFLNDMEYWLEHTQSSQLSDAAWQRIEKEVNKRWKNILIDPDATHGRKQKPKYKDRQKALAKRLLPLKPQDKES